VGGVLKTDRLLAVLAVAALGCAGGRASDDDGSVDSNDSSDTTTDAIPEPDARVDGSTPIDSAPPIDSPVQSYRFQCSAPAPAGSPMPPAPPRYSGGACPTLAPGVNAITSNGEARSFILVTPTTALAPGETLPVLFLWHWIGGSANSFLERGDIQAAADEQHFIAVIPFDKGANVFGTSFDTRWPFDITQSGDRMNEEFEFFDDMLSCVTAQQPVNSSCVATIGVSAGALFTDQLAQARSQYLASFVSLSGGVGATIIKPWTGAARKLPALVLWGGDGPPAQDGVKDILGCAGIGMDFSVASRDLEEGLVADGHFMIECRHNCGHVEPPLEVQMGSTKYGSMWSFVLDHPYWLPAGTSPYQTDGLVDTMPSWCAIGAGSSVPRMGTGCPEPENPCPN
jgi:predicted esterase